MSQIPIASNTHEDAEERSGGGFGTWADSGCQCSEYNHHRSILLCAMEEIGFNKCLGSYSNGTIISTAQSTTCPYGTAPVFDEVAYTVGRDCAILQDYAINPYYYGGATVIPSLSSQCAVKWTSSHDKFLATAETGPSSMDTVTANFYAESFSFTPTAPCCSSCTLSGANVQVRFWPTPAPVPAVSILVDPDTNFT